MNLYDYLFNLRKSSLFSRRLKWIVANFNEAGRVYGDRQDIISVTLLLLLLVIGRVLWLLLRHFTSHERLLI